MSYSGCQRENESERTHANSPAPGSKRARKKESERPGVSGPASGSRCQREGESERTHANSPATGSKRARKKESERPDVHRPASGSGCQRESESERTHANSPATASKRTRKEESERPSVSGVFVGAGHHRGWSEQPHVNAGASDGQCPVEVIIVDGPDDSSVTKSSANGGRGSPSTSSVVIDLDAGQDPSSSSLQKRKDGISRPEADTVNCLSTCEVR